MNKIVFAVVVLAIIAGGFFYFQQEKPVNGKEKSYFDSPFGILGAESIRVTERNADFGEEMKELNVFWLRPSPFGQIIWERIEKTEGSFDWSELDERVKTAQENGLHLMPNIIGTAKWDYEKCHSVANLQQGYCGDGICGPVEQQRPEICPLDCSESKPSQEQEKTPIEKPCDLQAYKEFVGKAVERYDGDGIEDMPGLGYGVKVWIVYNEPDFFGTFWNDSPESFADTFQATAEAVKQADSQAIVVMAGSAGSLDSYLYFGEPSLEDGVIKGREEGMDGFYVRVIERLKQNGFDFENLDVLDFHLFGSYGDYKKMKTFKAYIERLEKDYSFNAKTWVTETGTYSGTVSFPEFQGGTGIQTEEEQSEELVKRFAYGIGLGIEKIVWVTLQETGESSYFGKTGLIEESGRKKLSFYSLKLLASKISSFQEAEAKILKESEVVLVEFNCNSGKKCWIAWGEGEAEIPSEKALVATEMVPDSFGNFSSKQVQGNTVRVSDTPVLVEEE